MWEFATSGFLYQSNKLVYDRFTRTLWHSMTGEPVIGRLTYSGLQLEQFPITLTTWADWLSDNSDTMVLSLKTGFVRAYPRPDDPRANYFDYSESSELMFPVYESDNRLEQKAEVFALAIDDAPKAYSMEDLKRLLVVNDSLGGRAIVIVADPASGAARAYERDSKECSPGASPDTVVDGDGAEWLVWEEQLLSETDQSASLARLPGHQAYWFGWRAFQPATELYSAD